MSLIVRNDEQIQVGVTVGLITGASSFTFDGTGGKPDYRNYEIVPDEIGVGILIKDVDYSWDSTLGIFTLLSGVFVINHYYHIHFQQINQPIIANYAAIINASFFVRNINIPNPGDVKVLEKINSFIGKYEPECMKSILGYSLYKLFLNETSQRMIDILSGAEYNDSCGELQKWEGLVHDTDISLIANYIYYFIQESSATQTTGVSTSISKPETGTNVSPADKMINAWNFFSDETASLCSFLWNKKDSGGIRIYPEFTNLQFYKTRSTSRAINFMGL